MKQDRILCMHEATFVLFSHEAGFQLCGYVNSLNKSFPMFIQEVPFHYIKVGMWCTLSANRVFGSISTKNLNLW
jgi:hypothetical protein